MPTKFKLPTRDEEAAIRRGIAADPENPELDAAAFANMQPKRVLLPEIIAAHARHRPAKQKQT